MGAVVGALVALGAALLLAVRRPPTPMPRTGADFAVARDRLGTVVDRIQAQGSVAVDSGSAKPEARPRRERSAQREPTPRRRAPHRQRDSAPHAPVAVPPPPLVDPVRATGLVGTPRLIRTPPPWRAPRRTSWHRPWRAPRRTSFRRPVRSRGRARTKLVLSGAGAVVLVLVAVGVVGSAMGPGTSASPPATAAPASEAVVAAPESTPPPTVPAAVEPLSATGQEATFTVPAGAVVELGASQPCWVGVSSGGAQLQRTLQPGEHQQLQVRAPTRVRLGNPTAVDVTIAGAPADVPAAPGQPFDLVLQPGGA
jgi:hypothetical protein